MIVGLLWEGSDQSLHPIDLMPRPSATVAGCGVVFTLSTPPGRQGAKSTDLEVPPSFTNELRSPTSPTGRGSSGRRAGARGMRLPPVRAQPNPTPLP
jgi:hypothetical protein